MESDEVRVELTERNALARAEASLAEGSLDERAARELVDCVRRLAESVESLLAERDAFASRLRRGSGRVAAPAGIVSAERRQPILRRDLRLDHWRRSCHVGRRKAFFPFCKLIFDHLAVLERTKPLSDDAVEMNEHILALGADDESKAFLGIKPLHLAADHDEPPAILQQYNENLQKNEDAIRLADTAPLPRAGSMYAQLKQESRTIGKNLFVVG